MGRFPGLDCGHQGHAPGGLPVAYERPAQRRRCSPHVETTEGSLEAWEEAGVLSLHLPSGCAGQRGVGLETKHFRLGEREEGIATAGPRGCDGHYTQSGRWPWRGDQHVRDQERWGIWYVVTTGPETCGLHTMASHGTAAPVWGAEAITPPLLFGGSLPSGKAGLFSL